MNNQPLQRRVPYEVSAPQYSVAPQMVTTAFELPGYRVAQNLGVVRGIVVRSRNVFVNIGAAFQTLVGGNITAWTQLCEQTRAEAFDIMVQHATELGANAIIGARYDATEIASGATEVLAYGTAVVVEPTGDKGIYQS
ncbi:MAG TPA: YbjQ family protein [Pyrinomonadaceae bacterium]|nr:YbjQ family protein [Pyrinomonadaceae bacterium]